MSKMKKAELSEQLKRIEDTIVDIDQHSLNLEKKINEIYESVLRDLKEATKEKLNKLMVVKIETKRQYDELIWTDSFVKYQQQLLKPGFYIEVQGEYERFKRLLNKLPLQRIPQVLANDIDIQGEIRLIQKRF